MCNCELPFTTNCKLTIQDIYSQISWSVTHQAQRQASWTKTGCTDRTCVSSISADTASVLMEHITLESSSWSPTALRTTTVLRPLSRKRKKGKEEHLYSAIYTMHSMQSAQAWITQFYLRITPCLPFLCSIHQRSPPVQSTVADIQLQLTTHYSTLMG